MFNIKISHILIFIILIVPLKFVAQEHNMKAKNYKLKIDNSDFTKIGYKSYETDQSRGPVSICLVKQFIYLVDNYHGNVKEIDILNGEITNSSAKLSSKKNPWPRDIAYFNEKFYVTCDIDSIYILNKRLEALSKIPILGNSPKYFTNITRDSIGIYIENEYKLIYLKKNNLISNHIKSIELTPYLDAHGKKYAIYQKLNNEDFIKTEFLDFKLEDIFPDISTKYDAINIDFDENTLVYFDINEEYLELFVYMK